MNSQPANLLLQDSTPPCHNRPPFADGRWHATGERRASKIESVNVAAPGKARPVWQPVMKPVLRWHPRWFEQRCATHDGVGIGPNGENYPAAHGWDCTGCRWRPAR